MTLFAAAALVGAVFCGCTNPLADKVHGTYIGHVKLPPGVERDPNAPNPEEMEFPLTLTKEGGFSVALGRQTSGRWTLSGDTLYLNVEKVDGVPLDLIRARGGSNNPAKTYSMPMKLQVSDEGDTLSLVDASGGNQGGIVFKRSKKQTGGSDRQEEGTL